MTTANTAVTTDAHADFTAVVLEVLRRRPDVRADEVAAVLGADPDYCAQEVIDTLDTAAADARADLDHDADLERE